MKKLFSLICLFALAAGSAFAQKMVVRTADGKVVKYNVTKVMEVTFEEAEPVEWVDLGLPSGTLWASCNIGANSPEEYGDFFAWGETETKEDYSWSTYSLCDGSKNSLTKYTSTDNLTELLPEDDAASTIWDVSCKMPSYEQIEELINSEYTTSEWTELNGVNGTRITSKKNGNSIFFPAAGIQNDTRHISEGEIGLFWSRTRSEDPNSVYTLYIRSYGPMWSLQSREGGKSIRPVREKEKGPVLVEQIVLTPSLSLELSYYYEFKPKVLPEDADNKTLEWESSNTSIATVSNEGRVLAIAEGTCTITCRATDGSGVFAECQVTAISPNDRKYVDLGLPSGTLWATMNVGAHTPEEQGDLFRWGETEPYDGSGRETYKFYEIWYNGKTFITKYSSDPKNTEYVDYLTELEPEDDAATANWGEDWQMPNKAQMEELLNSSYTIITYTTQNDINGLLITSRKYGTSIFLPTQKGYWTREVNTQTDPDGHYTEYYYGAYYLWTNWIAELKEIRSIYRHEDKCVRPVRKN